MELNEKPTVMAIVQPLLSLYEFLAKARLPNKRYPEHLERNAHRSIEDLRENISCGIQLQHKWSRQHKYLLASVDVKNPHANFNDLENSVPLAESNDDLLDQAWDDHTGASLDAKKVKEARQLEMEYYHKMHVFDEVLVAQCWERTGKAHLKARWVDIDKGTRYQSRCLAKQFKESDSEEWSLEPSSTLQCNTTYTWSCVRRRRRQSKITTCVQSCARACVGPRLPLEIGRRKFKKRWPHSVSQLVMLHPFCSVIHREV